MFCVSFLSHLGSALCACFISLVLSHALGYVAAPLAGPKREYLADELVRQRDEVVQRGVRRADLAAVREAAEGQDLQPRRHDVRAPGTSRVNAVYLGSEREEMGIGNELGVLIDTQHSTRGQIPHFLPRTPFPFTANIYGGPSTQEHVHNFRKRRTARTKIRSFCELFDDHRNWEPSRLVGARAGQI